MAINCREDSIKLISQTVQVNPEHREQTIFGGLLCYLKSAFGEYLTSEQILNMATSLRKVRNREFDSSIEKLTLSPVTDAHRLGSFVTPCKCMRKDELALMIYNLAPYALLNRKEAAFIAKAMFPNLFASVATINSTFTKYYSVDGGVVDVPQSFSVITLPDHTTETIEHVCYELGKQFNQSKEVK